MIDDVSPKYIKEYTVTIDDVLVKQLSEFLVLTKPNIVRFYLSNRYYSYPIKNITVDDCVSIIYIDGIKSMMRVLHFDDIKSITFNFNSHIVTIIKHDNMRIDLIHNQYGLTI